jgi:positive regulator of sigma E activity
LGASRKPAVIEARIAGGIALRTGDRVRLEFVAAELLRAAWLAYGLPLTGLVAAALLATRIAPGNELAAVACAALGLLAGAAGGRRFLRRGGCLSRCVPVISERLAPDHP